MNTKDSLHFYFRRENILLVEDNEINIRIIRNILESWNLCVEVAENGKKAIDMFYGSKENYFNLILMDICMPVMNGYIAAKEIRNLKRNDAAKIPILAISTKTLEQDVIMAIEAGMNEHLCKPVDAELLLKKLQYYLSEM